MILKKIIVDIEKIKDTSNKEQRIKRKQFYLKNDFKETDVFYTWQGEDYVILSRNGIVQKKRILEFLGFLKEGEKMKLVAPKLSYIEKNKF